MRIANLAPVLALLLAATSARADENADLDLIPSSVQTPSAQTVAPVTDVGLKQRIYLEQAFSLNALRNDLPVAYPLAQPANWQDRLFLDVRKEWALADTVNFTLGDRFNLRAEDDLPTPNHRDVINEFREGYVGWQVADHLYWDMGRINLKSGPSVGYNPTDFFKTRAVVDPISSDPQVLREDRMGVVMARGQYIGTDGSVTAAFAPSLAARSPVYLNTTLPSFDPSFDRTNSQDRMLLKGSTDLSNDLSSEALVYRQANRTSFGTSLTEGLGQSTVAYVEWAGGRRGSLIDEALRYGSATGSFASGGPVAMPVDQRLRFQNDLSAGASYATENKVTVNLEYHFHQAGFSEADWSNWFSHGANALPSSPTARQLWYIRAYAAEQQEPMTEHVLFLRADWVDAFIPNLELTSFVNMDLLDGSALVQVTADYFISNAWTAGVLSTADLGRRHSDYGSLPQSSSIMFKVARYF